ncbi:hypothetical protein [Streptomyces sp. NPDC059371]|uniref:hypothetical protein n=1 Tax=Streptomyces sp. NPDC059371 TaxID=3346812 RepID=UPI0036CDC5BC
MTDYNGKKINLAEGWQGAQVCGEDPDAGEAKCWDSVEDSNRDAADAAHASPSASGRKAAKGEKSRMAAAARPAAAPADGDTGDDTGGDDYTDDATGDGGSTTAIPDQPEPAGPGSGVISNTTSTATPS